MSRRLVLSMVAAMLLFASCARVFVTKAGEPNSQGGFRYYLPRPFLTVKQPFPIGGSEYYLTGERRGSTITVNTGGLAPNIRSLLPGGSSEGRLNLAPRAPESPASSPGLPDRVQQTADAGPAGSTPDAGAPAAPPSKSSVDIAGDQSGRVPLNDIFDLVYLPDFEEQYIIDIEPGIFGAFKGSLGLSNGWMLNKISVDIDNSALGATILKPIGTALDAVSKGLTTALGITSLAQQSAQAVPEPVTVKVTLIQEALPGLYPVLKEKEASKAIIAKEAGSPQRLAVAVWPHSMVSFSVRERVSFELIENGLRAGNTSTSGLVDNVEALAFVEALASNSSGDTSASLRTVKANFFKATLDTNGHAIISIVAGTLSPDKLEVLNKQFVRCSAPAGCANKQLGVTKVTQVTFREAR